MKYYDLNKFLYYFLIWCLFVTCYSTFANSPSRIITFSDRDAAIKLALSSNLDWNFAYRVIKVKRVEDDNITKDYPVQIVRRSEKSFFNHDKFILKPESTKVLNKIGKLFATFDAHIIIVGHTDDTGTIEYNKMLARKRAKSVYSYLTKIGFSHNKLHIIAMGEAQPIADNNTDSGRAFNRRVEFFIADEFETARLGVEEISPDACYFQERTLDGKCTERTQNIEVMNPRENKTIDVVKVQTGKPQPLEYRKIAPNVVVPREHKKPARLFPRGG